MKESDVRVTLNDTLWMHYNDTPHQGGAGGGGGGGDKRTSRFLFIFNTLAESKDLV